MPVHAYGGKVLSVQCTALASQRDLNALLYGSQEAVALTGRPRSLTLWPLAFHLPTLD